MEHIARIIADGVARGEFTVADPAAAGRAVFDLDRLVLVQK